MKQDFLLVFLFEIKASTILLKLNVVFSCIFNVSHMHHTYSQIGISWIFQLNITNSSKI